MEFARGQRETEGPPNRTEVLDARPGSRVSQGLKARLGFEPPRSWRRVWPRAPRPHEWYGRPVLEWSFPGTRDQLTHARTSRVLETDAIPPSRVARRPRRGWSSTNRRAATSRASTPWLEQAGRAIPGRSEGRSRRSPNLPRGDHLLARFFFEGLLRPQAGLVLGHYDTVWPIGTLATMPFRVEGGQAFGPGVFDMKASLVEVEFALGALIDQRRGSPADRPVHRRSSPRTRRSAARLRGDLIEDDSPSRPEIRPGPRTPLARRLAQDESARGSAIFVLEVNGQSPPMRGSSRGRAGARSSSWLIRSSTFTP